MLLWRRRRQQQQQQWRRRQQQQQQQQQEEKDVFVTANECLRKLGVECMGEGLGFRV